MIARAGLADGLDAGRLCEPAKRHEGPHAFHHTEGPGAGEHAVRARQRAAEREQQHEETSAALERVHRHHEGDRDDAEDRDHGRNATRWLRAARLSRRARPSAGRAPPDEADDQPHDHHDHRELHDERDNSSEERKHRERDDRGDNHRNGDDARMHGPEAPALRRGRSPCASWLDHGITATIRALLLECLSGVRVPA
jgi:hypothetical protein